MTKTILHRAVLAIVKEVAQDKRNRRILPEDVLRPEINVAVGKALDQLVEMGELNHRSLSINKIDAYAIPETSS